MQNLSKLVEESKEKVDEPLAKLRNEQDRLNYRLKILKRVRITIFFCYFMKLKKFC